MSFLHTHCRIWWCSLWLGALAVTFDVHAQAPTNAAPAPSKEEATQPPANADTTTDTHFESTVRVLNRSAESIKIGEPLHLRVHIEMPERAQLVSVRPAGNPFVERVNDVRRPPAARTGLAVTVFRPGTYEFAIEALWIDPEGRQRSTRSAPIKIRVTETVLDHEHVELAPPGDYLTLRSRNWWLIGGGIAALTLLIFAAAWMAWRRFKPSKQPADLPPAVPSRPAWEVALEEINLLRRDEQLLEEDRVQFHHRISEILRTWLQGRFSIRAPEMTSEEILAEISPRRLVLGGWIEQIHMILADSDLVKFAKFAPSKEHSLVLLQELEDLVREVHRSDTSPPDIPSPIEGDEVIIHASEHAAPQYHQPGVAVPRYVPEDAPKPAIVSLDFRNRGANKPPHEDGEQGSEAPFKPRVISQRPPKEDE